MSLVRRGDWSSVIGDGYDVTVAVESVKVLNQPVVDARGAACNDYLECRPPLITRRCRVK